MAHPTWTRAHLACSLALVAALLLALAAPAGAVTRKQASKKALAALGSKKASGSVIVFGLKKSLRSGTAITQGLTKKGARPVMKVGRDRAFFYYEDSGPFQPYPHAGRVALVNARTGKVRLSKKLNGPPRIKGLLPIFLKNANVYRSPEYQVYYRTTNADAQDPNAPGTPGTNNGNGNAAPKANSQDVRVKKDRPRNITLTGSDDDGDFIVFVVTKLPSNGTLSGSPPDVTYTPNPGYLGSDDFSFRTYDDVSQSNVAKVSIDVVPLGLPPTVATSAGCTAYNARAAAVVVDGLVTTADPDDTQLAGATVRIAANHQGGDDLLFTDQNGIQGSYDDNAGVLTLSGDASVANYQTALRSVRYRNLSTSHPALTKDVAFTVNDAGSDSAPATKQVCITPGGPNQKPIGEVTSEGAVSYTENDGPVPVDAGFVVLDDGATISGASVKFTASQGSSDEETGGGGGGGSVFNFFPGEDRLVFTDQNGITGSYNSATGVLTLSGSASVADYQTALSSVAYENTSENPAPDPRTIRFQVTDSDGANSVPSTRDVYVTPVNDAPTVTPSDGAAAYTEGDPTTTIDAALTAGDVDNSTLSGAQVRISSGFQPGDELSFTDQNGISGVYNPGTGELTLSGTASVAGYQSALQSIGFRGTSDDPPATKTVEYVVNDGELDSAAATKDIAVTPVNDAPTLSTTASTLAYAENAGPAAVDPGITASDPDSATFAGATVQISGGFDSSQDQLAFTDQNGITGAWDSETGTLALSGSASLADYQTALQSVTYENSSDNPSTATRTVTFQVDDGGAENNLSNSATRDVSVTPSNDAPVVTTSDGSTTYNATTGVGVAVDGSVAATDVDDTNLESAQVRISDGFQSGDDLVFVDQNGILGVYDTGTGVLTLTGSAPAESYVAALQSIEFRTTAESPGTARTVEFLVNDGDADSNAATKSIDITTPPPNDAPVVTTSDGTTAYGLTDPPVAVDSGVTVTDATDTDLEGARVRISGGFEDGDSLGYEDQNGIFGTYDPESGVLTLSGTASVADYQTALQSVTFQSAVALQTSKTIEFVANDGDVDSNAATKTITVGPPTF